MSEVESEEALSYIECMPQMAFIANARGEITFFNHRWYEFIGNIEGTEGNGWRDKKIHHPEDLERTIQTWEYSVLTGEPYEIEYRLKRYDGQYRWHLGRANPMKNKEGQIVRWIGTNTDIHDQKTSQQLFELIIETIPQGIWRCDPDGSADYCSQRFCEMVGRSRKELMGWGWVNAIHPEDRDNVLEVWQHSRERKEPVTVEFRVLNKKSNVYSWHLSQGNPLFAHDGKLIKYYGTWTNIHQERTFLELLKTSEARFKTIAEAIPQMIWTTNAEGLPDFFNQRWLEFLGIEKIPSKIEEWNNFIHPEDMQMFNANWFHSLESGVNFEVEYRLKHRSGNYRWVLARAIPVKSEQGKIVHWMGTATDIQDQKDRQRALLDSVKGRDEFLSITSHELKTPLTSLKLMCQMLQRSIMGPLEHDRPAQKFLDFASKVAGELDRLTDLVDEMLDVSRIQSGRLNIQKKDVDIVKVLSNVLDQMGPQFEEHNCPMPERSSFPTILKGKWDPYRIEQIFTNLLSNALRYGDCRPVNVRLEKLSQEVHIAVEDHGPGIPPELTERIFEKFESGGSPIGLGLGLFITKKIVEAHRGKIWVESKIGQGSTFHVELPYS